MASGLGALRPHPARAVWSRVGGDLVDLATLAMALGPGNERRGAAKAAIAGVVAITALDLVLASALTGQQARAGAVRDFSDRSGFPMGVEAARGAAARSRSHARAPAASESEGESRLL